MKNKKSPLLFIATFALGAPAVYAADLAWDNSNTSGIQAPLTGTWTDGAGGWRVSPAGTVSANWAAANVAIFSGGTDVARAVTVGGTLSAQKISFVNGGYTLSGTAARVITLTSTAGSGSLPQLAVTGGKTATIGSNVTVNAQNTFYIGADNGTAGGTLNIEGGTVGTSTNLGASLVIDGNGTVVNVKTGGTLRLMNTGNSNSNAAIVVGQLGSSNASLNVDGGSVLVNQGNSAGTGGFLIGNIGQGAVTLTNGTIEVLSAAPLGVTFGNNVASAGANVLHLDGGTLTTSIIRKGAGTATATFNFNGGLLKANKDNTSFMTGLTTANVKNGGAKFDTNGFNITVGQDLVNNGSGGLTKTGDGVLTLSGTNTYVGATTITAGTLSIGAAANLGNAASDLVFDGGTLRVTGTTITNLTGLGRTNPVAFNAGKTVGLDVADASNTFTVGQALNQTTGGFTKLGAGKAILDQTNTYTGATHVQGGTLAINGSVTTDVTVQSGATLGGNGTITGNVSILAGGTFAAGNSIDSIAIVGDYSSTNGLFGYELDANATAGAEGDLTTVTGNLTLTGTNTLVLTETLPFNNWALGSPLGDHLLGGAEKLTLIAYNGTWNGGLFTYLGNLVMDDSAIVINGQQWWFNYNDNDAGINFTTDSAGYSKYVTITVPEPGAALLGGLGMLALLRRRRH